MDGTEELSSPEAAGLVGETVEIVPRSPPEVRLTPRQSMVAMEVYRRLASMLPTEGRDYRFSISFDGDGDSPSLHFAPITPVGSMWCDYIAGEFRKMTR